MKTPACVSLAVAFLVACSNSDETPRASDGGMGGVTSASGGVTSASGGSTPASGGTVHEPPSDSGAAAGGVVLDGGRRFPSSDAGLGVVGKWVKISPPGAVSTVGVGLSAAAPSTLYVDAYSTWPPSGDKAGIYKSTDRGETWRGPIGSAFYGHDGEPYTGENPWSSGVAWTIAVDPTDPDVVYAMCAFFGPQGLWKSTDGGDTWRSILSPADTDAMSADIYAIAIDPANPRHVLITFHSGWHFTGNAGVAESLDGGASWIQHAPQGDWGAGHYAFFLGRDDAGKPSSDAWMLATQGAGFWRTLDAGKSWAQVTSSYNMQHGAGGLYRASTGVLYMGAVNALIRSENNGKTWSNAGAPGNQDGYNAVIGDGVQMFVQSANTGSNTTGPQPFYASLETDGTHWTPYNAQTFGDGPGWMAADRPSRVVYAALWDHGLHRLVTGN